ncbi:MAG: hypothetical protein NXI10_13470 [bacterium]|nr:hypothetical protein [bacterium]
MTLETCIKYLDFVANECTRYLNDRRVTDDELISLVIEMQRFQEKCLASDLPEEIKEKIAEIKLNYSIKKVERSTKYLIVAFITFGSWALLLYYRQQAKRKQILNEIKFDTSRLASSIRMNYS